MPKLSDYEEIAQEYAIRASSSMNTSLHIAFLYGRSGVLLAMSTNRIGSRSRGAGYSKYTIHAERAVLKMVGDYTMLRGATLVVVRVSKKGELMGSMPCHECMCHLNKAIEKYGMRRVYYSAPINSHAQPPRMSSLISAAAASSAASVSSGSGSDSSSSRSESPDVSSSDEF
jgi:hypothetical protein